MGRIGGKGEVKQEGIYGKVWREGGNYMIILQSQNKNKSK